MQKNNFILIAGGTGGHTFPAINFGNFLIKNGYSCSLFLDKRGLKYSNSFKGKIINISSRHFSGNFFYKILSFFIFIKGFFQSLYYFSTIRPKYCIAFGSYASFMPLAVASIFKLFNITEIYLHEQNSVIGKVNMFFLPIANNIFLNFSDVKKLKERYFNKISYVGLPRNYNTSSLIRNINDENKIIKIFVYGGSQSSINLNRGFIKLIRKLPPSFDKKLSVVIQSSQNIFQKYHDKLDHLKIEIENKPFFEDIYYQLCSSDLVIARSGAGTIDDIITTKTPSILVPLPNSIDNHQFYNAKFLADKGAAKLIDEKDFDNADVLDLFLKLLRDENLRINIINNLKSIKSLDTSNLMIKKIINK